MAALLLTAAWALNVQLTAAAEPASEAPEVLSIAVTSDPRDDIGLTIPYRVGESGRGVARSRSDPYGAGDTIDLTVTFDKSVQVTGSPTLDFEMGTGLKTASFASLNDKALIFEYPVVQGDEDRNGIAVRANSLSLSGGTIKDQSGTNASLSHDPLPTQRFHKVDGIPPRITSIKVAALNTSETTRLGGRNDEILALGEWAFIEIETSERVYASIAGPPQITIQVGDVERKASWFSSIWGRGFIYTIQEGDLDENGISINASSIDLNGGTIQDEAGNPLNLSHAGVSDNWETHVDGVTPVIKQLRITSKPGQDKTYGPGNVIRVTATFSEPMKVSDFNGNGPDGKRYKAVPALTLNIGGTERTALYERTDGKKVVFAYPVQEDDQDANGISIAANSMTTKAPGLPDWIDSLIRDDVGTGLGANDADLSHRALRDAKGHKVGDGNQDPADEPGLERPGPTGPVEVRGKQTNNGTTVTVSWTAPDTGGTVDRYIVWMKPMDGSKGSTKRVNANKLTVKFKKVQSGTTYRFSVRGENAAGKGDRVFAYITP